MINSITSRNIIISFLTLMSFFSNATVIDNNFLSNSSIYNTFERCNLKENSQICIDYLYNLKEEKKIALILKYSRSEELSTQEVSIEKEIEKLMLILLGYFNPKASEILNIQKNEVKRDFSIAPFSLNNIIIGVSTEYKGENYSGYYMLSLIKGAYFSYDVKKTNKSPIDMIKENILSEQAHEKTQQQPKINK